ncbi:MAG: DUF6825 family protein [Cyanophyceae cyanobacterium]
MSRSNLDAFFFGRALAEALYDKLEDGFTDALSEIGKFDAEQRERLRQFMQEVSVKAEQEAQQGVEVGSASPSPPPASGRIATTVDLQAMIDELRAEIARLRAELKAYSGPSASSN